MNKYDTSSQWWIQDLLNRGGQITKGWGCRQRNILANFPQKLYQKIEKWTPKEGALVPDSPFASATAWYPNFQWHIGGLTRMSSLRDAGII